MTSDRLTCDTKPGGSEMEELLNARMSLSCLMNDTHPLKDRDYELIGRFVQTYCIADIEARRVINCLTHIRLGDPTKFALKLNDKDALDHLMACADSCVWNLKLSEGIRKAAEILMMHRHLRHMFAHWAGRRVPGRDVFIFFTASLDKQKLPKGATMFEEDEDGNMQYGVVPISNLHGEMKKLEGHVQYLANIGADLEAEAETVAKTVAQDVAASKLETRPYKVSGGDDA